jgi:hypothetical protein
MIFYEYLLLTCQAHKRAEAPNLKCFCYRFEPVASTVLSTIAMSKMATVSRGWRCGCCGGKKISDVKLGPGEGCGVDDEVDCDNH